MPNQISNIDFYIPTKSEAFNSSIFSEYMEQDNTDALAWALNVTQKCYEKGVVNAYLERGENNDLEKDKDYIDFWAAICILFAYMTKLVRKVGIETDNREILYLFLKQKGFFNYSEQLLDDLVYLMENFYDEIRKRGTFQIQKRKIDGFPTDGEARRIFGYFYPNEYIFIMQEPDKTGLWVDRNSPNFKGLGHFSLANKINELPFTETPTIDEEIIEIEDGEGFGGTDNEDFIEVSPFLPYLFEFEIKMPNNAEFNFGVFGFDAAGNQVDFVDFTNTVNNSFLENVQLPLEEHFYKIKTVIYSQNLVPFIKQQERITNLNIGVNLIFNNSVVFIIPQFVVNNGNVEIKNFKFTPAYLDKENSFVQINNFFHIAGINNNGIYSKQDLINAIRYYMLPYDSVLALKLIEQVEQIELTLEDFLLSAEGQGIISGLNLFKYK